MTARTNSDPYRFRTVTKSGLKILIRPIRKDDRPLVEALFQTLSPETLYFRFFMRIKAPTPEMVTKLVDVDHERDVVLVAVQKDRQKERILGVFRFVCCREGKEGEFSLLVGDPWHGQGVGARLFQYGLSVAKSRGIRAIWGYALAENKVMLHFAQKLGFAFKWDEDMGAYEMRMDL